MSRELQDDSDPVRIDRRGPVTVIVLSRPGRLNAVSLELYQHLVSAVTAANADDEVRVLVLTGEGRAFCAGADLKAHAEGRPTARKRQRYARTAQRACLALQRSAKPVVAAVNGAAVGAGLELALSCDLIVAASDAKLRLPELSLGTFVGGGVTQTLPERVGMTRARELLLLGEFFSGEQAAAMHLANWSVPADQVLTTALAVAERLAAQAPIPVRLVRQLLRRSRRLGRRAVMAAEARALEKCMASEDWQEGVVAFRDKRTPQYRGR
jgi:enoyl-CoA hydratase